MHPPAPYFQDQLYLAVRPAGGHSPIHQLVFHLFRRQPFSQHPDYAARFFLLLEEVAVAAAQPPVEKCHWPAAVPLVSSLLPISTATRHTPSAVFRQIVT